MKKYLLFLFVCILFVSGLSAQSLELMKKDGSAIVNDSITITTSDLSTTIEVPVYVKNNGSKSMDVSIKVYEQEMVSGSSASYCWGASCFDITTNEPDAFTSIAASDTAKEFHSDYVPNENAGLTEIMYTFYNKNNRNDSVSISIYYNVVSTTGIEDQLKTIKQSIQAYPNPVQSVLYFNYNIKDNNEANIAVYDIVGKRVKTHKISASEKNTNIDFSNIKPGIYIWTFELDDVPIKSEKIIKR